MRRVHRPLVLLALVALVAVSCSESTDAPAEQGGAATSTTPPSTTTTTPPGDEAVFPDPDWATADPADHGMDPAALADLDAYLEENGSGCGLVVKDGYVVDEQYWLGFDADSQFEIYSASKSVSSTLVGIAQDRGLLDIEEPAADFIPGWKGTDSEAVTIRNLLSNDSGREWNVVIDYGTLVPSEDRSAYAVGLGQDHPPGEMWAYNNSAIQTLEPVLRAATGEDPADFAKEALFEPIGSDMWYVPDAAGNIPTFMGVQASCRDAARFGYLFLRQGRWGDEQVVSSAWVDAATTRSQELNTTYGFLWWLNEEGQRVNEATAETEPFEGLAWPDSPDDAYAAQGLGGQLIVVVPSEDLVLVRLATFGASREGDVSTNGMIRRALGGDAATSGG